MGIALYWLLMMLLAMSSEDIRKRSVSNMFIVITYIGIAAIRGIDSQLMIMTAIGGAVGYIVFYKIIKAGAADGKIMICISSAMTFEQLLLFMVFMLPVLILYGWCGERIFMKPYPFVPGMTLAVMITMAISTIH